MKKKGKIIIFVVIIVLIVVAIAIGIYKNNVKQSNESVTSGETENNISEQNEITEESKEDTHESESEEIKLTEIEAPDSKKEIPETKKFEKYEIDNLTLYLKDGESTLIGKIKNTSEEVTPEIKINLTFTDEKGEEIITLGAVIVEMEPGTETELNTSVNTDITNATDFTITRDLSN